MLPLQDYNVLTAHRKKHERKQTLTLSGTDVKHAISTQINVSAITFFKEIVSEH